ncbi:acyl-CoA thioesterase [Candidatus Eisenbacteria bacterium]|uniref:Acyl-CoA thioesterase n=1 Tax=Eiseniibacteriota bacterium TaxID=2212470 RepID=A0ABV6YI74_UNCEI
MQDSQPTQDASIAATLYWDPDRGLSVGRTTVRVRYAETDRMGITYNAHYLTWFEIGRTEFMRSAGFPYREVEEKGYNLPLVGAEFRLPASVGYDDVLFIETWVERVRTRMVTFAYRVLHDGRVAASGTTTHACVRASDGRSGNLPDWLQKKLRQLTA